MAGLIPRAVADRDAVGAAVTALAAQALSGLWNAGRTPGLRYRNQKGLCTFSNGKLCLDNVPICEVINRFAARGLEIAPMVRPRAPSDFAAPEVFVVSAKSYRPRL
jgi:hypothetical protein